LRVRPYPGVMDGVRNLDVVWRGGVEEVGSFIRVVGVVVVLVRSGEPRNMGINDVLDLDLGVLAGEAVFVELPETDGTFSSEIAGSGAELLLDDSDKGGKSGSEATNKYLSRTRQVSYSETYLKLRAQQGHALERIEVRPLHAWIAAPAEPCRRPFHCPYSSR
jgi:hypothetical protein